MDQHRLPPARLGDSPAPYRSAHDKTLDALEGAARKAEGERATSLRYSDDAWRVAAYKAIHALATSGRAFTSDDVIDQVGMPPSGSTGAVGAMVTAAVKAFGLMCVGSRPSSRRERRGNRLMVWQDPYYVQGIHT
jgi:chloramphenicol 3-O-phosphotransferase